MSENPQRSLVRKINEIMAAVGYLKKEGTNKAQNYKFIEEAKVIEAVRGLMIEKQLVIWPATTNIIVTPSGSTSGGASKNLTTVDMKFTIEDGESGETRTISMGGQGIDPGDKGIYKAETGANKYALLKLFQIPTGDDPELDTDEGKIRGDQKGQQRQQQNSQQQRPNNQQSQQQSNNQKQPPIEAYGLWLNYSFEQLMDLINAARKQQGAPPVMHFNQMDPQWTAAIEDMLKKRIEVVRNGGKK
jgi:ERF superfamily